MGLAPGTHPNRNLQVGLGFKSASGKHDITDTYYGRPGTPSYPVDQSVQAGDGDTTDLFQSPSGPYSVLRVSVPDVFSVKGGMGYTLWPRYGVTATLGARLEAFRSTTSSAPATDSGALIGFVDPSISISRGDSTFQIDVPVRIFYNFRRSEPDVAVGRPGGGDLADSLLFIVYTHRLGGHRALP